MISALIRFSIKFHWLIIFLAFIVLVYGSYRLHLAGLDIFPEFSPKRVIIQTEAPGLASEHVETSVTKPIEAAISGSLGLIELRSESIQGLSIVTATFNEASDVFRNRQLISERLNGLTALLPKDVTPVIIPLSSSSATLMTIGLQSDKVDLMVLRSLVDRTVIPQLLSVPGVADVNVFGGEVKQLQIQLNPLQLKHFNLSLSDVTNALKPMLQQHGGGFIENANQRFTVQVFGFATTPSQFEQLMIPLAQDKTRLIRLSELGNIRFAPEPAISAAQIMGKPGIVLMILGQYGANTLSITKHIEQTLNELTPVFSHKHINFYPHLFRPADYIERSVASLASHLVLGAAIVVVILYVFLYNWRTAFISALAIPMSLIGAVLVLLTTGQQLNIMVLGGLAIVLGEVVDDAIIDTENIFRRLRENALKSEPLPSEHVIYSASLEVRSSVVYASFIVALVFTPLLTLSGVAGRLFAPLGYSYILAILISLLTALSLTPALAKALLAQCKAVNAPPLTQWLLPIYSRFLVTTNRYFVWLISLCVMASVLALIKLSELPSQFLPELREGHYIVHTTSAPGTSLTESIRIGQQLTQHFLAIPGVESVSQWAGRAGRGADTYGSHYSEFEVRLKPLTGHEQHAVLEQIRTLLNNFPGISSEANTFLTERIDETISGYTAPVAINIFGNDLTQLDQQAESVANIVRNIKGSSNVQVRSTPTAPLLAVNLKPDAMNFWQVSSTEVLSVLQAAFEARNIGLIQTDTESYGVSVTLAPEFSQEPTFLKKLPIRSEPNKLIELDQIADIQNTNTRYAILHEGGQRRQTVTSHVLNRDLDDFMQELRQRILTEIAPAQNTIIKFTGAAIEQAEARQQLIIQALLAGAGVLMLSYLAMQSLRHVMITLANLPFALIGGILAVLLTDTALSVGAVVGFITLFGITARNSIMLIAHYRYLLIEEKRLWNLETMVLGAGQRLPSIVMTALVTALAMLPIALNSDNPGREIMGPMASIIIGGLLSSTLLNLLLLPMLLLRFGDFYQLTKRNVVL
mgnify:CR=1 FL=1